MQTWQRLATKILVFASQYIHLLFLKSTKVCPSILLPERKSKTNRNYWSFNDFINGMVQTPITATTRAVDRWDIDAQNEFAQIASRPIREPKFLLCSSVLVTVWEGFAEYIEGNACSHAPVSGLTIPLSHAKLTLAAWSYGYRIFLVRPHLTMLNTWRCCIAPRLWWPSMLNIRRQQKKWQPKFSL